MVFPVREKYEGGRGEGSETTSRYARTMKERTPHSTAATRGLAGRALLVSVKLFLTMVFIFRRWTAWYMFLNHGYSSLLHCCSLRGNKLSLSPSNFETLRNIALKSLFSLDLGQLKRADAITCRTDGSGRFCFFVVGQHG